MRPYQRATVRPPVTVEGYQGVFAMDVFADTLRDLRPGSSAAIVGPSRSGKTTALHHAAALCDGRPDILCLDSTNTALVDQCTRPDRTILYSAPSVLATRSKPSLCFRLQPWTIDQFMEYLVATHRHACGDVLRRLSNANLPRIPAALWTAALTELALDPQLATPHHAIERLIERAMPRESTRCRAGVLCLVGIHDDAASLRRQLRLSSSAREILAYDECRHILATRVVVSSVCRNRRQRRLPMLTQPRLIAECARIARTDHIFRDALRSALVIGPHGDHAAAITILHESGDDWKPTAGIVPRLILARLDGLRWPDLQLPELLAVRASLRAADFSGCDLTRAKFTEAALSGANLSRARAGEADFTNADLARADLRDADLHRAEFADADLSHVMLDGANCSHARFQSAKLHDARLVRAQLCRAFMNQTDLTDADLSGADLDHASLDRIDFRSVRLEGVRLCGAWLHRCNFVDVAFSTPDWSGTRLFDCDLSGSVMSNPGFSNGSIRNCGLADIQWENADLRNVDFRLSTFHAGSSRSGLVSAGHILPASEGSRTGFYTDDYADQTHMAPEVIRKANLCGADLTGANIEGVDFYLVDLRRARYSTGQAEWFKKCGAILVNRR